MELLKKAKGLRKNQTDVEGILWSKLRNRQCLGYKFRRQLPIVNYIADFACLELKLIIELDGGQHADAVEYDLKRTFDLEKRGFKVVRFWNHEVLENLEGLFDSRPKEPLCISFWAPSPLAPGDPNPLPEGEGTKSRR